MSRRNKTMSRDRRERLLAILAEPDTLGDLCGKVASGATLLDVAQEWDVKYGHLHEWIHAEDHPERVQAYSRAMEARASYIRDKVTRALVKFMGADLRKAFDKKGRLIAPHKLPDDVAEWMQALEVTLDKKGDPVAKIKAVDKIGATALLGRTQAMFSDKVDVKHSGTIGLADKLNGARQRVINGTSQRVED